MVRVSVRVTIGSKVAERFVLGLILVWGRVRVRALILLSVICRGMAVLLMLAVRFLLFTGLLLSKSNQTNNCEKFENI